MISCCCAVYDGAKVELTNFTGTSSTGDLTLTGTDFTNHADTVANVSGDAIAATATLIEDSGIATTDGAVATPATAATFDITGLTDGTAATVDTIDIAINGTAVDASSIDFSAVTTMQQLADELDALGAIGASLDGTTLTITNATTGAASTLTLAAASEGAMYDADSAAAGTYSVTLDGGSAIAIDADYSVTAQDVVDAIDNDANFSATLNTDGQVEITKDDHSSFTISEAVVADGTNPSATAAGLAGIDTNDSTYRGQISMDSTADIVIEEVTAGALAAAGLDTAGNATTTINLVDISTRDGATTAISSVDAALAQIDTIRGDLGAVQNRFESTISNLSNVSENLSAARSRILDADIAMETSAMTKNNILQQAGVSILAQANQAPQLALSLLG